MGTDALTGVRVVDFSWAVAGPYATECLALMGAEVIRIESMRQLDVTRTMLHPITRRPFHPDQAFYYMDFNLNKLGVRLNLSHPWGVELARELVKISDIAVDSFRPGVMDRLGLGYQALKKVKPDIIMLATSAGGACGPEAQYAGYAPLFNSTGGLGELTGYSDGPPTEMRATIDAMSAFSNAFALLVALHHRRETGEGQFIDTSSQEAVACLIGDSLLDYTMNGRVQTRNGNRDDIMAPHNCYRCYGEDRWISIAVATGEEWQALCQCMGDPEWTKEERFSDAYSRWQNQEELDKLIQEWTVDHSNYELMEMLQGVGVAAAPSFDARDLFGDPHLDERGFCQIIEHPGVGASVVLSPPWKLSATPTRITRHAPLLGEHNQHVFGEMLGLSSGEMARLEEEGVFH